MSTEKKPSEYMLLFRGKDWDQGLAPEEAQELMGRVIAWMEGLQARGKVKGGQPLGREGHVVSSKNGRVVADGPFAESKEAVGGFLVVLADDIEEAMAMARENPTLHHGVTIEVRPVLEQCPVFQRLQKEVIFTA
jgi:hypothetical protein